MPTVDLIRHGEPVGGRRYRGTLDDPLSLEGWRQMEEALISAGPWQRIYTSPLRRCREFALDWGSRRGIPVTEDRRLQEMGFGLWEGKTPSELRDSDPAILRNFYRDPLRHWPRGAEDPGAFRERVIAVWQELADISGGAPVLVVTHAGVIRAVLGHILAVPAERMFSIQVENAAVVRIAWDEERPPAVVLGTHVFRNETSSG